VVVVIVLILKLGWDFKLGWDLFPKCPEKEYVANSLALLDENLARSHAAERTFGLFDAYAL
jgi:hypothetical protein